ncbi:MAG TPA: acyl carrier protein [Rhizomicrobium sp.]|jgi:acyl carrier protein
MPEISLRDWVRDYLAQLLRIAPGEISFERTLGDYGLDSVDAVLMAGEMEQHFGIEIDPASFIQYDTFEDMISALEGALHRHPTAVP